MYLHLGGDIALRTVSIVGIFDLENTSQAKQTRRFLAETQRRGRVVAVGSDLPRSFVLAHQDGESTVYLSQISPATLLRRAASGEFETI